MRRMKANSGAGGWRSAMLSILIIVLFRRYVNIFSLAVIIMVCDDCAHMCTWPNCHLAFDAKGHNNILTTHSIYYLYCGRFDGIQTALCVVFHLSSRLCLCGMFIDFNRINIYFAVLASSVLHKKKRRRNLCFAGGNQSERICWNSWGLRFVSSLFLSIKRLMVPRWFCSVYALAYQAFGALVCHTACVFFEQLGLCNRGTADTHTHKSSRWTIALVDDKHPIKALRTADSRVLESFFSRQSGKWTWLCAAKLIGWRWINVSVV